jgi:flagellar biosynthesis/type III secretory pathway chaperone
MADPTLALLDQELAAVVAVRAALEAERAALESRDAAALLAATARKSAALEALARIEAQRTAHGTADGTARGTAVSAPDQGPAAAGLRRRTDELRTLTRHCRQLNAANGALIRAQRQRVEGLLQALTGGVTGQVIYRPDGLTASHRAPRGPLATA